MATMFLRRGDLAIMKEANTATAWVYIITILISIAVSTTCLGAEEYRISHTAMPDQHHVAQARGADLVPLMLRVSTVGKEPQGEISLPTRFDWRGYGKVTPVKDQGRCGASPFFAALAQFESKLRVDGDRAFDFSENNVKECEWYGSSCGGSNFWRVVSFLSANGAVLESCDPYVDHDVACRAGCRYIRRAREWRVISGGDLPAPDLLKTYIYEFGPVYAAMYAGMGNDWFTELRDYDGSYTLFYDGPEWSNQAILIVGWDDTLSHAGGQGAWIVKNSWGTDWGGTAGFGMERGYFTIAYGSAMVGTYASFIDEWEVCDPKTEVLFHDEAGYTGSVGYGDTTAWGMCRFLFQEPATIERVELWTNDVTTHLDVYVYGDFDGATLSSLLSSELDNSFGEMGYHSIQLSDPVFVGAGEEVFVAVKINNASYIYPVVYDALAPPTPGTSYLSPTGSTWMAWDHGDIGIRIQVTRSFDDHTWYVPSEVRTIADAVQVAGAGDTISVAPGVYREGGISVDKDLIIFSEAGAESTTINAHEASSYVLEFEGVSSDCRLDGFTLTRTRSDSSGAGVLIIDSDPRIVRCIVSGNQSMDGAGVRAIRASPEIVQCTVYGNGDAAGVDLREGSTGTLDRCIIANTVGGPGLRCLDGSDPEIVCCDIWGNTGGNELCGTEGGGNFSADPRFCDRQHGDFHLYAISPCAHRQTCGYVGALGIGCGRYSIRIGETGGERLEGRRAEESVLDLQVLSGFSHDCVALYCFRFSTPSPGHVRISMYDVRGRCVGRLVEGSMDAGVHTLTWDGRGEIGTRVAPGTYFVRIESDGSSVTRKTAVVR